MSSVPQFGILPAADATSPAVAEGVFLVHSGACGRSSFDRPLSLYSDLIIGRKPPGLPWPDIGPLAKWSVSSFKFGFGPECLQDEDPDTFWQLSVEPHAHASRWFPLLTTATTRFFLALMDRSRTL